MEEKVQGNNNPIEEQNIQQVLPCKVYGRDEILTDPDLIAYYKVYLRELTYHNKLIGTFTDEGQYIIREDIKRELIKLDKEHSIEGQDWIVVSQFMQKIFKFEIRINVKENGTASASLYLIEPLDEYSDLGAIETFIARINIPYDEFFVDKVKKVFHVVDTKGVNTESPILAVLLQKLIDEELVMSDFEGLGSQIYIMRTLKMLESAGKLGQEVIDKFKKATTDLELTEQTPKNFIKQRRVLDDIIKEKGGFEALEVPPEEKMQPVREYIDAIQKASQATMIRAEGVQTKQDAKPAPGKTAGKTPVKKSSNKSSSSSKSSSKAGKSSKPNKAKASKGKSSGGKSSGDKSKGASKSSGGVSPNYFDIDKMLRNIDAILNSKSYDTKPAVKSKNIPAPAKNIGKLVDESEVDLLSLLSDLNGDLSEKEVEDAGKDKNLDDLNEIEETSPEENIEAGELEQQYKIDDILVDLTIEAEVNVQKKNEEEQQ